MDSFSYCLNAAVWPPLEFIPRVGSLESALLHQTRESRDVRVGKRREGRVVFDVECRDWQRSLKGSEAAEIVPCEDSCSRTAEPDA